jgi:hypothetical protein
MQAYERKLREALRKAARPTDEATGVYSIDIPERLQV